MADHTLPSSANAFSLKSTQLKSCNLSYLYTMSGGEETFVKEMVSLFLKQVPLELEKLNEVSDNSLAVKQIAHKLKSSVSMIGAAEMLDDVKALEAEAGAGIESDQVLEYQEKLQQHMHSIQEELQALMSAE